MQTTKSWISGCLLLFFLLPPLLAQKRAITIPDMWAMNRIGAIVLSPDGEWIAYEVSKYNIDSGGKNTDIYLINTLGGSGIQLTTHPGYDGNPVWSPDASLLAFLSDRSGSRQIHVLSMRGGEARQVSFLPTEIKSFQWSPDGKHFAFTTDVWPTTTNLDSSALLDRHSEEAPNNGRIIDRLFYRHWNDWRSPKRTQIYVMPHTGEAVWHITSGPFSSPPEALGSKRDYCFSPDGREIAFVRNADSLRALSTNNDIYIAPVTGGSMRRLTKNPGNDNHPTYSPDGKWLAFRAMARAGFEADQVDLLLIQRETDALRNLTGSFDLDVGEVCWSPSGEQIYFTAEDQGRSAIFVVNLKNSKIKGLIHQGHNSYLHVAPDETQLFFRRTHSHLPHEVFISDEKGEKTYQLSYTNKYSLEQLEMNPVEDFWYPSYDNKIVHGLLIKPPFFDPAMEYPMILLIHGGPQGSWKDQFHYRWNAQLFASRGYVVAMINPRGSKGYGQEFCDAVTKNWGGGPYRDLMEGVDYLLEKYPFIKQSELSAAGASYGGYMVNWIAGHTDRFNCLVSHAGISNPYSFYGATEELWFPEWEFDGNPYDNPKLYDKWSPLKYAEDFKTPTLVVHGEKDFRVPVDQGLQMFTALQRRGVPSKLLYFEDEDHFINKPRNSIIWWNTVLGWIDLWNPK